MQAYQQQAAAAAAGPGQLGNAGNHASLQHFAAQQGKMDQVRISASLQSRPLLTQPRLPHFLLLPLGKQPSAALHNAEPEHKCTL